VGPRAGLDAVEKRNLSPAGKYYYYVIYINIFKIRINKKF
jgi:hypothetical protein